MKTSPSKSERESNHKEKFVDKSPWSPPYASLKIRQHEVDYECTFAMTMLLEEKGL